MDVVIICRFFLLRAQNNDYCPGKKEDNQYLNIYVNIIHCLKNIQRNVRWV